MNIRPILNKLIVKPQDAEKETSGGIIIANAKNEGVIKGNIVAAGPGAYDDKGNFVKVTTPVGSTILFNNGVGSKFEHDDEEYVTIVENDIIAILS